MQTFVLLVKHNQRKAKKDRGNKIVMITKNIWDSGYSRHHEVF